MALSRKRYVMASYYTSSALLYLQLEYITLFTLIRLVRFKGVGYTKRDISAEGVAHSS